MCLSICWVAHPSPRFKSFGSSLNSLNAALRPNLRPNSDDSLCHVIDSCEILGSTWVKPNENKTDSWLVLVKNKAQCSYQNPECANSNYENLPNKTWTKICWKLEQLKSESPSRKLGSTTLRPESYFLEFFKSPAQETV